MMSERELFKMASVVFAIGLFTCLFIFFRTKPKFTPINEIDESLLNHQIETEGTVKYIYSKNGNYFLTIENETKIKVVVFSNWAKKNDMNSVKKGNKIIVVGKVNKYKGELEIIGQQIFKVS